MCPEPRPGHSEHQRASRTLSTGTALITMGLAVTLIACFDCEGVLRIVSGSPPLQPGESIQLELVYDGETLAGPGRCDGYWTVEGEVGGTAELGTTDRCGQYTAPTHLPPSVDEVQLCGFEYHPDMCADCCPYGCLTIRFAQH